MVVKQPIAFHQNQKTVGTKNASMMLVPTPATKPILTSKLCTLIPNIPSKNTARTGPKNTEPTLFIASITVGAIAPAFSDKTNVMTPHATPIILAIRR